MARDTFAYRAPTELMHTDDGWAICKAVNAEEALAKLGAKTTVRVDQLQVFANLRWNFADRVQRWLGGTAP